MPPMVEMPGEALKRLLYSRGLYTVGSRVWLNKRRLARRGFQHVAVEMLVKEYDMARPQGLRGSVVWEEEFQGRRMSIVLPPGDVEPDAVLTSRQDGSIVSWRELASRLPSPPLPMIVIDMSMRFAHLEEELSKLKLQLALSLQTVRDYLWDPHLAITSLEPGLEAQLNEILGINKATLTSDKPSTVLWGADADRVIILRPDAPHKLTAEDVLEADAFLIGGIVDRIPRPGLSRMLDNLVPWGLPRRIELRGSIIGVPDRINRIVEIVLKARYEYEGDVEKAIIDSMSRRDAVARAFYEISKASKGQGRVSWRLYTKLSSWLPISRKDFLLAAKKARVEVTGTEPPCEGDSC